MNHTNIKIIVNPRNNHPYGVARRLQFFAHNAGKKLVLIEATRQRICYAVVNL